MAGSDLPLPPARRHAAAAPPGHSTAGRRDHSHSIILSDRNALNSKRKFFLHPTKNRLSDPSEISALEFKGESCRLGLYSVSVIIDIDRSTSLNLIAYAAVTLMSL